MPEIPDVAMQIPRLSIGMDWETEELVDAGQKRPLWSSKSEVRKAKLLSPAGSDYGERELEACQGKGLKFRESGCGFARSTPRERRNL